MQIKKSTIKTKTQKKIKIKEFNKKNNIEHVNTKSIEVLKQKDYHKEAFKNEKQEILSPQSSYGLKKGYNNIENKNALITADNEEIIDLDEELRANEVICDTKSVNNFTQKFDTKIEKEPKEGEKVEVNVENQGESQKIIFLEPKKELESVSNAYIDNFEPVITPKPIDLPKIFNSITGTLLDKNDLISKNVKIEHVIGNNVENEGVLTSKEQDLHEILRNDSLSKKIQIQQENNKNKANKTNHRENLKQKLLKKLTATSLVSSDSELENDVKIRFIEAKNLASKPKKYQHVIVISNSEKSSSEKINSSSKKIQEE